VPARLLAPSWGAVNACSSITEDSPYLQPQHVSASLSFRWLHSFREFHGDKELPYPTDPALFQLSGGTTGIPKLIPRTHNDYLYNSRAAAAVQDITPESCQLCVLPLAHNMPLACPGVQGFLMAGARVVIGTSTKAPDVFELIERHRVTHVAGVPALYIRWLADAAAARHDLTSVLLLQSGGQRLQPEVRRRMSEAFPNAFVQENFGMSEGTLFFVRKDAPEEVRLETVGRPVSPDDEVRLTDEDGRDVSEGEVGELTVRGPYTLRGYYRATEYNARQFTPDGFYRSGDLMRRHPSGAYLVEGRIKDLVNRGGEKISAEEVENLILTHPAVRNVACIPLPDPVLGERMCACVIPQPGRKLTLEELARYLTDMGIAKFKLPERLELMVAVRPTFHEPAIFAKQAANIDHISGGRLALNVVSSWWKDEARRYGINFEEHDDRYARTDEWLSVVNGVWKEARFSHAGSHYKVEETILEPKPLRRPRPTIYAGGESPAAKELISRTCDAYVMHGDPAERVSPKILDMRARREKLGLSPMQYGVAAYAIVRDSGAAAQRELSRITNVQPGSPGYQNYQDWISHTTLDQQVSLEDYSVSNRGLRAGLVGTPERVAERIRDLESVGVDLLLLQFSPQLEEMERFAETVMPLVEATTSSSGSAGAASNSRSQGWHPEN